MAINKCFLVGNLTREPELRTTQGGTAILRLGIAVNDRRRNQQTNQWEDVPNFFDLVLFGKRAESLADILSKGMKVSVEGRLHWSQWEAKDGTKRSRVEVWVDELELPQRQRGGSDAGYQPLRASAPAGAQDAPRGPSRASGAQADDVYDEGIPF